MADPSIVEEWLQKADEDFRFAEAISKAEVGSKPRYASISNKQPRSIGRHT